MSDTDNTRWLHPGFTRDSVLSYLFKKGVDRADTSLQTAYYREGFSKSKFFIQHLATDEVPEVPPNDFVKLTNAKIAELFGIHESEVDEFKTTIRGDNAFSVEQSLSFPYILRICNLYMKPFVSSIDNAFTGLSSKSQVNVLCNIIPTSYGNGSYRPIIKRTKGSSGELSQQGTDVVHPQHLAHILDTDAGILTLHEPDTRSYSSCPISSRHPPAITCYVYQGTFGKLGLKIKDTAAIVEQQTLLLGKETITDPSLTLDVSGVAFIMDVIAKSVSIQSDIRLKENIVTAPINDKILSLDPVYYNYIKHPGIKEFGLIAQNVQKVAPEIVKENNGVLSVQYDRLGVYLLPIVKEQQARIETLEQTVALLLKAVESLKK